MAYIITNPASAPRIGLRGRLSGGLHPPAQGRSASLRRPTQLYIHPDECIDCGACVPACPVEAIFAFDEVPDKWKDYVTTNSAFYQK